MVLPIERTIQRLVFRPRLVVFLAPGYCQPECYLKDLTDNGEILRGVGSRTACFCTCPAFKKKRATCREYVCKNT